MKTGCTVHVSAPTPIASKDSQDYLKGACFWTDLKLQQRQLEEQRRLLAALHSRNCMLTALNSNLIMQLNLLRPSVPVQQESSSSHPRSLHLRIALPGQCNVSDAITLAVPHGCH